MKRFRFTYLIAAVLLMFSLGFFALQHLIFHEPVESGFLFFQDLAFMPLHVLFVSLILDRIINAREKRERMEQMNVVIGFFYSELGSDAIRVLNPFIRNVGEIDKLLAGMEAWSVDHYARAAKTVAGYLFEADSRIGDIEAVNNLFCEKRGSLIMMFDNPNLMENSRFTGMLWALYHFQDELSHRDDFSNLPDSDLNHLSGDIARAYKLLLIEWIYYMRHLKEKYPYLFSLAIRKSPFEQRESVVIYQ